MIDTSSDSKKRQGEQSFQRENLDVMRPNGLGSSSMNQSLNMSLSSSNQTMLQERNAKFAFTSFLEERNVPVITSLEQFYPKETRSVE